MSEYYLLVIHILSGNICRLIGKQETNVRFLRLALFQGTANANLGHSIAQKLLVSASSVIANEDPTLFCTGYLKDRFYLFTNRTSDDSDEHRDVQNEKPSKMHSKIISHATHRTLGKSAIIRTTMGDIHIKLFGAECPKAVENFTVHSMNGYYNNCIFHRVVRGFMIQTGDPLGNGTGGTSIWGKHFEDEFHRSLKHDRPGTVSMANAGRNTNGSQFFITTTECKWLEGKHTVFGRVIRGMDVVQVIEKVRVMDKRNYRPREPIGIINITIDQ